jgi:hypothetical protein
MKEVKRVESDIIAGKPAPAAYLFFTNHPYHYVGNDVPEPKRDVLFTAINVPEFKVINVENARRKHSYIFSLWDSIRVHHKVPDEFDES